MKYLEKIGKNSRKAFEDLKTVKHDRIKKALNDYNRELLRNKKQIIKKSTIQYFNSCMFKMLVTCCFSKIK